MGWKVTFVKCWKSWKNEHSLAWAGTEQEGANQETIPLKCVGERNEGLFRFCPYLKATTKSRAWKWNCKCRTRYCILELAGHFPPWCLLQERDQRWNRLRNTPSSQITGHPSLSLAEKWTPCNSNNFRVALKGITLMLASAGLPNILIFFFSPEEHETNLLNSWGVRCTQACLNWPFTLQHAREHGVSEVLLGLPALELFHSCWRAASFQVF